MGNSIGFVLLTHNNVCQVERLMNKLNESFNYPLIVCHHDFSQSRLDKHKYSNNVSFVDPYIKTRWGMYSLVEATLLAFNIIMCKPNAPDWVFLISGADYPIKSFDYITNYLSTSTCDAYIDYNFIPSSNFVSSWYAECYFRYHSIWNNPFNNELKCYAGSQWCTLSSKAIDYIFIYNSLNTALSEYYKKLIFSDESFFQTVLANSDSLILSNNNLRYIDWSENGLHPKVMLENDFPAIISSNAHFGRKFDLNVDSKVLDMLDEYTLIFK